MNITPSLRQREQPKKYYDYDGITGAWLWLPWWLHIVLALLMWPLFLWIIPMTPFNQLAIKEYFSEYALRLAQTMSAFCFFSALLSYTKSYLLKKKRPLSDPAQSTLSHKLARENLKPSTSMPLVKTLIPGKNNQIEPKKKSRTKKKLQTNQPTTALKAEKSKIPMEHNTRASTKSKASSTSVQKKTAKNAKKTQKSKEIKKQLTLDLENC